MYKVHFRFFQESASVTPECPLWNLSPPPHHPRLVVLTFLVRTVHIVAIDTVPGRGGLYDLLLLAFLLALLAGAVQHGGDHDAQQAYPYHLGCHQTTANNKVPPPLSSDGIFIFLLYVSRGHRNQHFNNNENWWISWKLPSCCWNQWSHGLTLYSYSKL